MSKRVIILSGVSGSGKSTYAQKLVSQPRIFSADQFFMVDGEYKFNPAKLGEAHADCFKRFILESACATWAGDALVIVDNTNTTIEEIAPYVLGAQAFGWQPEIHTLRPIETGVSEAYTMHCLENMAKRNKHGVSLAVVTAQYQRLLNRKLPSWWNNIDIDVEV